MNDIVIVSGVRMAVGSFEGSLKGTSAQDLGALVIKEAATRAGISPGAVDEIITGQAGQIAESGFVGRTVSLKAGLPQETTAYSVNRQCGSGFQVIAEAIMKMQTGQAGVCVACGTGNIFRLPYYIKDTWWEARIGHKVFEGGVIDILTWPLGLYCNDVTAENVAEQCHVSRREQDAFALENHRRATQAIKAGKFKDEIVPVGLKDRKGNITMFDTDRGPRKDLAIEKLQKLKPCSVKSEIVTAGNALSLNDGAGVVVIISGEKVKELGRKLLPTIKGYAVAGSDRAVMGCAPKFSSGKLVAKLGLDLTSTDMVGINETSANRVYTVRRNLGLDPEKTNIRGGGTSAGHPVGATGVILTIKVMYEFQRTDKKDAMVSMCIGEGQGISICLTKSE